MARRQYAEHQHQGKGPTTIRICTRQLTRSAPFIVGLESYRSIAWPISDGELISHTSVAYHCCSKVSTPLFQEPILVV